MSIITISWGSFSAGQNLAERLVERLAYRCLSREILVEAAATYRVPEPAPAQFLDMRPGLWERLTRPRALYRIFLQAVMCERALRGRLLHHGQAGQLLLLGTRCS